MERVSVYEARNNLSRLIKHAAEGEDIVIAKRGVPVARLTAYSADATGDAPNIVDWLRTHPLPARLRRDAAALDASIEAESGVGGRDLKIRVRHP